MSTVLEKLGIAESDPNLELPTAAGDGILRFAGPFNDGIIIFEGGRQCGRIGTDHLSPTLRALRGESGALESTGIFVIVSGRVQSFIPIDQLPNGENRHG